MAVLQASLSAKGFEVSRSVMKLNRFLGDLVGGPEVLGEWAYTFCLFGTPSPSEPWGWQLFGHHLCLSCLVIGRQMVLTPTFLGAEPVYADAGPFAGTSLFEDEERTGLEMMRSLSREQQEIALVSRSMSGNDLPPGRWHFADHLHLGGAHQDNRIVPLEGLRGNGLSALQRRNLMDLVSAYVTPLPPGPHAARMNEVERHLDETHFCWIGGYDEVSPFYYRIQSPVIFIEFDHHSGVFLTNKEPAKFHVHTLVRTPNGNDYGVDLLRLHYAHSHAQHGKHHHGDGGTITTIIMATASPTITMATAITAIVTISAGVVASGEWLSASSPRKRGPSAHQPTMRDRQLSWESAPACAAATIYRGARVQLELDRRRGQLSC